MKFLVFLLIGACFLFLGNAGNVSLLYADEHFLSISEDGVLINESCQKPPPGYNSEKTPIKETNTCLTMKMTQGPNLDYVYVMPTLRTGLGLTIPFSDVIEISLDEEYQATIQTDRSVGFDVKDAKTITAVFPEQRNPIYDNHLLRSSEITLNIREMLPEDKFVLDEKIIDTEVSIDVIDKTVKTGEEIIITGKLMDQFGNSIQGGQVIIKTESTLNSNGMIAHATTENNGQYSAKAIAEDWSPRINLYAFYIGNSDQNYLYSISIPQTIEVEFKEIPIITTSVMTYTGISKDHNFLFFGSELADSTVLGPGAAGMGIELPSEYRLEGKKIEIITENSAITIPSSSSMRENRINYNQDQILISFFPAELSDGTLLKSSSKFETIYPESLREISESSIQRNVEEFVRSWDWTAVLIGLILGIILKIILEHWIQIKTLKNIAFIIGALVLIVLFAISEDNDISNGLEMLSLEQFLPKDNPYYMFGFLIAYMTGWIKEVFENLKIKIPRKAKQ